MFFFLTKKLTKRFAKKAHRALKVSYDPWKKNFLQGGHFEMHHYRLGQRRVVMF